MTTLDQIEQHNAISETMRYIEQRLSALEDALRRLSAASYPSGVISDSTEVSINNSVVETSIYSETLFANTLRTNYVIKVEIGFTYLNNSGVNRDITFRFKLGGATILTFSATGIAASATARGGILTVFLWGDGTTSSQEALGFLTVGPALGAVGTNVVEMNQSGTGSQDTTADLAVSVTAQHVAAAATITLTKKIATAFGPLPA